MPHNNPSPSYSISSFYESLDNSFVREKHIYDVEAQNSCSFEHYAKLGKFNQLKQIIADQCSHSDVLKNIYASGLCGCGGSHIPLVKKWEAAIPYKPEYLIVNGLEGEPFTFKDYFIMKNFPEILLEGIAISCRTLEINEVYIVINSAYKNCYENLQSIIENKLESLTDIKIHLVYGPNPDLYIVGEETALLNYIEGKRAEPRLKPPYPHHKGLWNKPSIINNVETLSWIPIILESPERFKHYHPKLLTILGDSKYSGIYEFNIGEPLVNIIQQTRCEELAFIELGGISGGFIPVDHIDVNFNHDDLKQLGLQIGSGSIRLFNSTRDPLIEMSKSIEFFKDESCGRCTPCRVGTQELVKFAKQLLEHKESQQSINWLHEVTQTMQATSTCGLGIAAPAPVLSYLKYFWKQ